MMPPSRYIVVTCFIVAIVLHTCYVKAEEAKTEIIDDWNSGFKGHFSINISEEVKEGWKISLTFPEAVLGLEPYVICPSFHRVPTLIWRADILKTEEDRKFIIVNKPWNAILAKYSILEMTFLVHKTLENQTAQIGSALFERLPTTLSPQPPLYTTKRPSSTPEPSTSTNPSQSPGTNPSTPRPLASSPSPSQLPGTSPSPSKIPTTRTPQPPTTEPSQSKHDYDAVLRKSILFYEAQRSGKLPRKKRVKWRGDSALTDKGDKGEDLSGGWYDAGDHVKFGFPMASSATLLAWGLVEYKSGYEAAGELKRMYGSLKWATDYFVKAHTTKYEFYGQVGDGHKDHAYWGRPEDMTMARPAFKITQSKPGSDLVAETAAALAAASIAFKQKSKGYAKKLLRHAVQLYDFADRYRAVYSESIPNAADFYRSYSGYDDELVWGAAWLYKATNKPVYLKKAEQYYKQFGMDSRPWAFSWDDKKAGVQLLLAKITGKEGYKSDAQGYLDSWLPGGDVAYTPKGLAWRAQWGPNRYAANTAFLALMAADLGLKPTVYRAFARRQIHYMLGDSGRSYVVGFGKNPPKRPHHRSSSCPPRPAKCDWTNINNPGPNPMVLQGALVGGPDKFDNYVDDRKDYIKNEVSTDYNAGFQSAVAGLRQLQ